MQILVVVCTESGRGLCVIGSNFSDNNVINSHGHSGDALYIDETEIVNITNCYFQGNTVSLGNYNGGALNVNQGKVAILSNNYFIDNNVATESNYSGNALYIGRGNMTVVNNFFCNKNSKPGYTIYISSGTGEINITDNCFIINDTTSAGDRCNRINYRSTSTRIRSKMNNSCSDACANTAAVEFCEFQNEVTVTSTATPLTTVTVHLLLLIILLQII